MWSEPEPNYVSKQEKDKKIEWFLDLVDHRPRRQLDLLQRDLTRMGFNPLFIQKYLEMRWELVDGLTTSTAERVN